MQVSVFRFQNGFSSSWGQTSGQPCSMYVNTWEWTGSLAVQFLIWLLVTGEHFSSNTNSAGYGVVWDESLSGSLLNPSALVCSVVDLQESVYWYADKVNAHRSIQAETCGRITCRSLHNVSSGLWARNGGRIHTSETFSPRIHERPSFLICEYLFSASETVLDANLIGLSIHLASCAPIQRQSHGQIHHMLVWVLARDRSVPELAKMWAAPSIRQMMLSPSMFNAMGIVMQQLVQWCQYWW